VQRYLEAFARRFDLDGLVRLRTEVVRVRRSASTGSWLVSYCSRKLAGAGRDEHEGEEEEEEFDAVVVCNGHFTEPRLADITGTFCMRTPATLVSEVHGDP
jgi:cation diffusion facilitator CzcD-associated flavoprotein CzcO